MKRVHIVGEPGEQLGRPLVAEARQVQRHRPAVEQVTDIEQGQLRQVADQHFLDEQEKPLERDPDDHQSHQKHERREAILRQIAGDERLDPSEGLVEPGGLPEIPFEPVLALLQDAGAADPGDLDSLARFLIPGLGHGEQALAGTAGGPLPGEFLGQRRGSISVRRLLASEIAHGLGGLLESQRRPGLPRLLRLGVKLHITDRPQFLDPGVERIGLGLREVDLVANPRLAAFRADQDLKQRVDRADVAAVKDGDHHGAGHGQREPDPIGPGESQESSKVLHDGLAPRTG